MNNNPFDFSYSYYQELLSVIKINFDNNLFSQVPKIFLEQHNKPVIFLRHDIDIDLGKALTMAEMEFANNIKSCFMVMTDSPFYSLHNNQSNSILKDMVQMGHEIGLHFNCANAGQKDQAASIDEFVISRIEDDCKILEDTISQVVQSVSFHRPLKQFLRGHLMVAGRINAYSEKLMDWYLSDSKGTWREGEPIQFLKNPSKPFLQLLVHPIWWGKKHQSARDRLQSFFEDKTHNFSYEEKKFFDENLSSHLSIYRSKKEK